MKNISKKAKIVALIIAIVLIAGIAVIATVGLNFDLRYKDAKRIELYLEKENILVMSGDHGTKYHDEVGVMKNYAKKQNVPSENIFMDHAGFSTYESIYRIKEIFGAKKIIIVTQKYHLHRALYLANAFGLEAYGVNSDPRQYSGQTNREIREIIARNKDFLFSIIK